LTAPATVGALERENAYLKQRNAQLQSDVADLTADVQRLTNALEAVAGRRAERRPDPLSGGQTR
jgi:cell division protein FtsB